MFSFIECLSYINKRLHEKCEDYFQMTIVLIQIHCFKKNVSCYCVIKPKENQTSPGICILCSGRTIIFISVEIFPS